MSEQDEVLMPEECCECKGFYYIPMHRNYIINKEGIVKRVKDFRTLKYNINDGYPRIMLMVNNKYIHKHIHRLLGVTFIGRPFRHLDKSFNDLMINHKNGIKNDNTLNNLEWVTHKENVEHAIANGLTANEIKVLVKDIRTNEIITIRNIEECARKFDIPSVTMYTHVYSKKAGTITKNWCVFKIDDGTPWKEIPEDRKIECAWGQVAYWMATNSKLNKTIVADNLHDLANGLTTTVSTLQYYLYTLKVNTVLDGWIISIKYKHISENLNESIKQDKIAIKVTNVKTNENKFYKSLNDCARDLKIGHGQVSWILNRSKYGISKGLLFQKI